MTNLDIILLAIIAIMAALMACAILRRPQAAPAKRDTPHEIADMVSDMIAQADIDDTWQIAMMLSAASQQRGSTSVVTVPCRPKWRKGWYVIVSGTSPEPGDKSLYFTVLPY